MLLGIHFFSSSAFAVSLTKNPMAAITIGLVVHHLTDYLPHLDTNIFTSKKYFSLKDFNSPEDYKKIVLTVGEFIIFMLLFFYLIGHRPLELQKIAFWGGVGGLLPDLLNFINIIFANRLNHFSLFRKYASFHRNFHYRSKNKILPLVVQGFLFLLSLILFLGLPT
jgi:hypothetical protein